MLPQASSLMLGIAFPLLCIVKLYPLCQAKKENIHWWFGLHKKIQTSVQPKYQKWRQKTNDKLEKYL